MKKLFIVTVSLLIVSVASLGGSTTATVTATVNAIVVLIKTADLVIPSVYQGETQTVLSTDAGAAAFTITGPKGASTTCTFTFPANLVSGTNNLPFTGQTPGYNNVDNTQSTQTPFSALGGGTVNSNSSDGSLYLWVGGKVTAAADQQGGQYTGTLTVGVTQP